MIPMSRTARVRGADLQSVPQVKLSNQAPGYPVISPYQHQQAAYEQMRQNGESHQIAEMLATQHAPVSRTTDDFLRGIGTLDKQIGDHENIYLNQVVRRYRQETGHNPNPNHVYLPGLAQYTGDPRAFVANEGEAKRRAEELNVSVDGFVKYKAREPERDPFGAIAMKNTRRAPIANDLKEMIRAQIVARNPEMNGRVTDEMIEAKHGNHVKER